MIASLALGAVVGLVSVLSARRLGGERWMYAAALPLLPLIYVVFAMVGDDGSVGAKELLAGVPWILGAVGAFLISPPRAILLVGVLWILHGAYDLAHDQFFSNAGVPGWYPLACAGTDWIIGGYLVVVALRVTQGIGRTSVAEAPQR